MFRIHVQWHEAHGVSDPLLAATWAQLQIRVADQIATQVIHQGSGAARDSVYTSALPLAEWITENWWFILGESLRSSRVFSTHASKVASAELRCWLRRHNLLAVGEGSPLPDMTICRDGARILILWAPDAPSSNTRSPVRFIERGDAWASPGEIEKSLASFVEAVLDRLGALRSHAGTQRLVKNWDAICTASSHDRDVLLTEAALGIDPYGNAAISTNFDQLVEQSLGLAPTPRRDLLDCVSASTFEAEFNRATLLIKAASTANGTMGRWSQATLALTTTSQRAYSAGYDRARFVREQLLQLGTNAPIADLESTIRKDIGDYSITSVGDARRIPPAPAVEAALLKDINRRAVATISRSAVGSRFVLARALHHWLFAEWNDTHRLLGSGQTWDQRASRSFAAELLAPAAALRDRVGDSADSQQVDSLASEFQVSTWLIAHQLENHGIAPLPW